MKKLLILIAVLFSVIFMVSTNAQAASFGVPYHTYTLGTSHRLVPTQTAFVPFGVLNQDTILTSPEDMYFKDDRFYIADTKAKRVVILDKQGAEVQIIKISDFKYPSGVFVDDDDILYVADKEAGKIFKFTQSGELITSFEKPTSPLFGKSTKFAPMKVSVASNGNIYIVGEGVTNGVITLNYAGEFIGYIGINKAPTSLRKFFFNLFVKDSDLAATLPPTPVNIALDEKSTIYTINKNIAETFKRLNISGVNTLGGDTWYPDTYLSDITISEDNYVYIVSEFGDVFEYDAKGNLLFYFNAYDQNLTRSLGLVGSPSGVEVDQEGNLYILDKTYNNIQMYQRTAFVNLVHGAVDLYNDGRYLDSKPLWEEILKQNTSFALAHSALGYALFKEGNNQAALDEFYIAKNYSGYSQVYWEIRNDVIQDYGSLWILLLIAFVLVIKVMKTAYQRVPLFAGVHDVVTKVKENKTVSELLFAKNMLRHPVDCCYGIQREGRASYVSAIIIFLLFIVVNLFSSFGTGFLFQSNNGMDGSAFLNELILTGIFVTWVFMNYLISTLNDGEGRFKDIFIASSYSLLPYIIIQLVLTIASHGLTYNESFLYTFTEQIALGWCLINLFICVQNIHNFSFVQTLKNILLTLFAMLLFVLTLFLVYMFSSQLFDFIDSIWKEVIYRVRFS